MPSSPSSSGRRGGWRRCSPATWCCWRLAATIWQNATGDALHAGPDESVWVSAHIATAVVTYALVTIAAVAALAAFLQERALKRKRPSPLSRNLPSIADCEGLQVKLLQYGEAVLAIGLATGMALQYEESGQVLPLNHKTVLTLAAFVGHRRAADRPAQGRGARPAGGSARPLGLSPAHLGLSRCQVRLGSAHRIIVCAAIMPAMRASSCFARRLPI